MTTKVHKVWSQKHYNAIAKEIREAMPPYRSNEDETGRCEVRIRGTLVALALSFARRFKEDSDEASYGYKFNPLKFLDACSPDPDVYPLSELWEEDQLG